jgi:hypothetical protein
LPRPIFFENIDQQAQGRRRQRHRGAVAQAQLDRSGILQVRGQRAAGCL